MEIILIRHTSVDVPKGICYGQSDVNLSSTSEVEIESVLEKIKDYSFDYIYSSPLKRCKILAERIAVSQEIFFDDRLMELNFGQWEGERWDDIQETEKGKEWLDNYFELACPEGESYIDFNKRITAFLKILKTLNSSSKVAIVSHGGVIRAIYSLVKCIPMDQAFKEINIDFGELIRVSI